jgi:hypothetical protein
VIDFLFLENLCKISIAFRHTIEVSPKVNLFEKNLVRSSYCPGAVTFKYAYKTRDMRHIFATKG